VQVLKEEKCVKSNKKQQLGDSLFALLVSKVERNKGRYKTSTLSKFKKKVCERNGMQQLGDSLFVFS
jgi:hypothetical protein